LNKRNNKLKLENVTAGFRACGIYPTDRAAVVKRLLNENSYEGGAAVEGLFNDAILTILKKHCDSEPKERKQRGKKITPGKAVLSQDIGD